MGVSAHSGTAELDGVEIGAVVYFLTRAIIQMGALGELGELGIEAEQAAEILTSARAKIARAGGLTPNTEGEREAIERWKAAATRKPGRGDRERE